MIHAREDYQRFQDPPVEDPSLLGEGSTPIGEDEPVMLFRSKDRYFVAVLEHYAGLLRSDPNVKVAMIEAVQHQIARAWAWRDEHGCKVPDMPGGSTPSRVRVWQGRTALYILPLPKG